MNEIIIAIIGSITTILAAVITGMFSTREIKDREKLIPDQLVSEERLKSFKLTRRIIIWKVLAIVGFFIGILFAISIISIKSKWETQSTITKVDSNYYRLIQRGIKKTDGDPYIIPNLLVNVNLERVKDSIGSHLEAEIYILYNVLYLKKIEKGSRAFDDYWRANRGGEVFKLNGSDKEVMTAESPTSKAWNMIYPANTGDYRITVSHFKVIYPSSLPDYESKFFGKLSGNEEEFAYPNDANDIIGEIVIMVSSSTLNLQLTDIHNAAIGSLKTLDPRVWVDPSLFQSSYKGKTYSTVVARFTNVEDKDVAKLKVTW